MNTYEQRRRPCVRPTRARKRVAMLVASMALAIGWPTFTAGAKLPSTGPQVTPLASFGSGLGSGSTIGPDGALYVTDGNAGSVVRIDPRSGTQSTYATGLPKQVIGIGGAMDLAFVGRTAYALVSVVGPFFGPSNAVAGLYRLEPNGSATVVADIGEWSAAHPPATDFFIPGGVQYSLHPFRGGFLVADGHHNRVLQVARNGAISELFALGNVVPTGLAVRGDTVYLAEAGPVPHAASTGKVVSFRAGTGSIVDVAVGSPLLVDVEIGRGGELFALSQGIWTQPDDPANAGQPASADTGRLLRVNDDGTFTVVVDLLDRPTSLEIVGDTAFVVTLTGKVVRIDGLHLLDAD